MSAGVFIHFYFKPDVLPYEIETSPGIACFHVHGDVMGWEV